MNPQLRASNNHYNAPSKLARDSHCGMALVVFLLRPSSEHIPIVRAPGAQDQHECHSTPTPTPAHAPSLLLFPRTIDTGPVRPPP